MYAELQVTTNFSFLRGASHPDEYVERALALGYRGIGITDHNSLAGVVQADRAASHTDIRIAVGCRLCIVMADRANRHHAPEAQIERATISDEDPWFELLVYPTSREGYAALCRVLTIGKRRCEPGACFIYLAELLAACRDWSVILIPPDQHRAALSRHAFQRGASALLDAIGDRRLLSVALSRIYRHDGAKHEAFIHRIAQKLQLPLIATGDVLYHAPERRIVHDVVSCIRRGCTIEQGGFGLEANSERHCKPVAEIVRLYRDIPQALARTLAVFEQSQGFSLKELRYEYPEETSPPGKTPFEWLCQLTEHGAHERFPEGIPEKVAQTIQSELALIKELRYEKYFLTCHDIVRFARSKHILCQGRGAAANSAVCYCLGITAVDPTRVDLLFARFISKERNEPPDIDIDFEHERREEVIQYLYQKYGRERAGLTAEVVTYRHRSAVREVGKVLGLSLDTIDALAKSIHRWDGCAITDQNLIDIGLSPKDRTVRNTIAISRELVGFPRHLSQHVGGFILSQRPLCESVPILNARMEERTIIEWDKDDIEYLGMLKIDVLALGMLTCIRKSLELVNDRRFECKQRQLAFHEIPAEDQSVYDMLCTADTVGVFQIESRAQMSMLPRLKPRCYYDLVIEVAIVRPGPVQGNMVHPFLRRRNGTEKIPEDQPPLIRELLKSTLGIPLFQEQAMKLAIHLADFSPGEAEQLRRAMGAWKRNKAAIASFKERIVNGMLRNGYSRPQAEICMEQIRGFSEYGFPESHAASFALLVYVSSWLKRYYPAEFAAALLNSQPMGFYAPAQIVRDLEESPNNIRPRAAALPIDIHRSSWDCTIEYVNDTAALRLGMRLIKGMNEEQGRLVCRCVAARGPFKSIEALWHACIGYGEVRRSTLVALAEADAFHAMGLTRHQALWDIRALPEAPLPLLPVQNSGAQVALPLINKRRAMFRDYSATGLSLRAHPLEFLRPVLDKNGTATARALRALKHTEREFRVAVAGIAFIRQRPGTAKGIVFISLEDETGVSNLIIRPNVYERFRSIILASSILVATGTLDKIGPVVYVNVETLASLDNALREVRDGDMPNKSYSY